MGVLRFVRGHIDGAMRLFDFTAARLPLRMRFGAPLAAGKSRRGDEGDRVSGGGIVKEQNACFIFL